VKPANPQAQGWAYGVNQVGGSTPSMPVRMLITFAYQIQGFHGNAAPATARSGDGLNRIRELANILMACDFWHYFV
jgi:hypothetical protein